MFQINLHKVHHWKDFDLEITDFNYHHDPTHDGKLYYLKPQTLKHVKITKFQINLHLIHHWKGLDLEFRVFSYHHDPTASGETIPSQTSNP